MSGTTAGQAFWAAYRDACPWIAEWDALRPELRTGAESGAQAAIAAQQPQPAPDLGASAPDRPTAKFAAWMASQGYPLPGEDGSRYSGDEMAAAFEGGITAAVVAWATRHDAQPAPDPGTAWRLLEETRNSVAGIAAGLEHRAGINRPSKVSEVCDGIAADLRKALS